MVRGLSIFLEIKDFLKPADVARRQELSLKIPFVNGRISNLQASEPDPRYARSAPFRDFALPRITIIYPSAQLAPVSVTSSRA